MARATTCKLGLVSQDKPNSHSCDSCTEITCWRWFSRYLYGMLSADCNGQKGKPNSWAKYFATWTHFKLEIQRYTCTVQVYTKCRARLSSLVATRGNSGPDFFALVPGHCKVCWFWNSKKNHNCTLHSDFLFPDRNFGSYGSRTQNTGARASNGPLLTAEFLLFWKQESMEKRERRWVLSSFFGFWEVKSCPFSNRLLSRLDVLWENEKAKPSEWKAFLVHCAKRGNLASMPPFPPCPCLVFPFSSLGLLEQTSWTSRWFWKYGKPFSISNREKLRKMETINIIYGV